MAKPLGEVLLEPTRIYWREVKELIEKKVEIKGMAHITGGGTAGELGSDTSRGHKGGGGREENSKKIPSLTGCKGLVK